MIPLNFTLQVAGPSSAKFQSDESFQSCQVANIGILFVVAITDDAGNPVDLRSATTLQLKFKAPDGTTFDKVATLYTNGLDGTVQFATDSANDIAQFGEYWIQAKYVVSGSTLTTRWGTFMADSNIDAN